MGGWNGNKLVGVMGIRLEVDSNPDIVIHEFGRSSSTAVACGDKADAMGIEQTTDSNPYIVLRCFWQQPHQTARSHARRGGGGVKMTKADGGRLTA